MNKETEFDKALSLRVDNAEVRLGDAEKKINALIEGKVTGCHRRNIDVRSANYRVNNTELRLIKAEKEINTLIEGKAEWHLQARLVKAEKEIKALIESKADWYLRNTDVRSKVADVLTKLVRMDERVDAIKTCIDMLAEHFTGLKVYLTKLMDTFNKAMEDGRSLKDYVADLAGAFNKLVTHTTEKNKE